MSDDQIIDEIRRFAEAKPGESVSIADVDKFVAVLKLANIAFKKLIGDPVADWKAVQGPRWYNDRQRNAAAHFGLNLDDIETLGDKGPILADRLIDALDQISGSRKKIEEPMIKIAAGAPTHASSP